MSETLLSRMKAIMENEGIKARQLTEEFGISNSSFTDWGKGKGTPSVMVLSKFAKRFDVSLDYLVFGSEKENRILEYSNPVDREVLDKFHLLSRDNQLKLMGYIDGLLSATQSQPNMEIKDA